MIIFRIKDNINNIKTPNIEKIINMRIFRLKMMKNLINSMIGYLTSSIILLMLIKEKHLDLEEIIMTKTKASLK